MIMICPRILLFGLLFIGCTPEWRAAAGSTTFLTKDGFPINFLSSIVDSATVQKKLKSRWKWQVWDVVPGVHSYRIYVFNVTNPQEYEVGGKPNLQQLGPYYYNEYRYKFGVSINLDLSVNFERNYTYIFDPAESVGSENDLINVLNLPLIIFSTIAAERDPIATNAAVKELTLSGESLIKRGVTVRDLLYHGIDVTKYKKYLNLLGPRNDLVDEFATGRYGVFELKDGPHEKPFVVDSGLINPERVGKIMEWNSQKNLSWWSGDRCNMINGSDSSVFPPYLDTKKRLQMFDLDICRSISFDYSNDMVFKNVVTGYQFNIAKDVLEDPMVFEPNMCFCKTPGHCLKKGVIDISNCRNGAPYVISYPHFLNASPEYLQNVSGLNPNPKIHQTEIDVEPVTGAVINFRKRFQWNIWLKPMPSIDFFHNIKPMVFPIIWNDDTFHLNPDKAQLLVEELANQMGGLGGDTVSVLINHFSANGGSSKLEPWTKWSFFPNIALSSIFVLKMFAMLFQF